MDYEAQINILKTATQEWHKTIQKAFLQLLSEETKQLLGACTRKRSAFLVAPYLGKRK